MNHSTQPLHTSRVEKADRLMPFGQYKVNAVDWETEFSFAQNVNVSYLYILYLNSIMLLKS